MNDERWNAQKILARLEIGSRKEPLKFFLSLGAAALVSLVPNYAGLSEAGVWTLFILVFAAALWMTEAIPAFAVALLAIGLEIAILGRPGGVFATEPGQWKMFVEPWASPVIWLFFGGFVLASAAARTGLDSWLSKWVLRRCGNKPSMILFGVMGITFTFSMFVSNTATTAMMIAVTAPLVATLGKADSYSKAILLGVPFAAGIGGMGTIIGSPPNAIAHGLLGTDGGINFVRWMVLGVPPALIVFLIIWKFLLWQHPSSSPRLDTSRLTADEPQSDILPMWQRITVMLTFALTVLLWMSGAIHGIPTPVVSFLPITVFAVTGVLGSNDVRRLHWDILLLLTGGLSLGVAVQATGLAEWLVSQLPTGSMSPLMITLCLAYLCAILSNFMSNTAAANIIIPIAAAFSSSPAPIVVPIALAASAAMCLPVSTPPNAIAFAQGQLRSRDFLPGGILVGIIAPFIAATWSRWILTGRLF